MAVFRTPQVILISDDLPLAVAFYSRLGFTETFLAPAVGEPIHVDLTLDGYRIGIASAASTSDETTAWIRSPKASVRRSSSVPTTPPRLSTTWSRAERLPGAPEDLARSSADRVDR